MRVGNYPYGTQIIAFSATPTFDCTMGNVFVMTLTGNVTSMTVTGAVDGQNLTFILKQDSSGLHSVVWPATFKGVVVIPITSLANTAAVQEVAFDASSGNFYAVSLGQLNL